MTQIPHRMTDGYGINKNLIDEAYESGVDTIITCDNGIAAIGEIAHAKELGMTVLVTDHHEIPYDSKFSHSPKALLPMAVRPLGKNTLLRLLH